MVVSQWVDSVKYYYLSETIYPSGNNIRDLTEKTLQKAINLVANSVERHYSEIQHPTSNFTFYSFYQFKNSNAISMMFVTKSNNRSSFSLWFFFTSCHQRLSVHMLWALSKRRRGCLSQCSFFFFTDLCLSYDTPICRIIVCCSPI